MPAFDPVAVLAALAEETRLRIALLLAAEGELCVCELMHALGLAQPKISRHLALLRELGLVSDRREGVWIHYRLGGELPAWVRDLLQNLVKARGAAKPYAQDRRKLSRAPVRPPSRCCAPATRSASSAGALPSVA